VITCFFIEIKYQTDLQKILFYHASGKTKPRTNQGSSQCLAYDFPAWSCILSLGQQAGEIFLKRPVENIKRIH